MMMLRFARIDCPCAHRFAHMKQPASGSARASSESYSVVHVLAFVTRESCALLSCWLHWMAIQLAAQRALEIELHVRSYTPPGLITTEHARWRDVLQQRLSFVSEMLERLPFGSMACFTDLDVVPFRPLTLLFPPPSELTFMREPPGHGGKTGRQVVNGGFYAMRVTKTTRQFFGYLRRVASSSALSPRGQRASYTHTRSAAHFIST